MNGLEINADDSSDEDGIKERIQEYNLEFEYTQFLKNENKNIPSYIQETDPEGYSLLAYALGVKQLYSAEVNQQYYVKKSALGVTTLNAEDDRFTQWFLRTLKDTVSTVFRLDKQEALTHQIASDFLNEYNNEINEEIEIWVREHSRSFFKQIQNKEVLLEIKNCLVPIREKINEFIDELELEENIFVPSPFFNSDSFDLTTQNYMKAFFRNNGFIRQNGCFETVKNWPKVKSKNPIEKMMIEDAVNYNGRHNISHVKTAAKKAVFEALLEKELQRKRNSIIEKIGGRYRLKQNVTQQLIDSSSISFLFNPENTQKYLPYNLEKLKKELKVEVEKYLEVNFIADLKEKRKQLDIKLKRASLPQQYTFVSKNIMDFHANIRLAMRVQRRRIRQARDDEEHETIDAESFQAGWQFGKQEYIALETQEISSKGACNDQVINLETYGRINAELSELKEIVNKQLEKNVPKLNDKLIAAWVRNIVVRGKPIASMKNKDGKKTHFENIPDRYQQKFLKLLVNLSYLLLGCEAQRNPASLIIHQMALDLIESGKLTWTQAISDAKNEKSFGGGAIPMTMGGYKKDNDKKATAHPVSCARALHEHYGLFAMKPWRYDGESSKEIANNTELVKRENKIVKDWLVLKKLDNDASVRDKIDVIEEAISSRWYPGKK